ncbi:MFS transporter [Thalassotalea fonticola]|uniref:MFS transporter n=1 Tax=Thalassotalea fonticola TaxID=3065649 RepID=A0ABZ0GTU5_9GAMM|nr:MFS transporter [Colwelliaceae bacterium S1-1]
MFNFSFFPQWQQRYNITILCTIALFICFIDRVNISVAILPMQTEFGWSDTVKGMVLASFFIGYMLMQIVGGVLASKFGGKIVLGSAVIFWSIFTMLTPILAMASLPMLILGRILLGLGEGASVPSAYSLFKHWVPKAEQARTISIFSSGAPLGTIIGLIASGWIINHYDWAMVFYIFGSLGFIWVVFWLLFAYSKPKDNPKISKEEVKLIYAEKEEIKQHEPVPWKQFFNKAPVWALFYTAFTTQWTLYLFLAWLPSYFADVHGFSITQAGLSSAAPWLTMIIMMNVAGVVSDKLIKSGKSAGFTRKLVQSLGLLGSALFLFLVLFVSEPIMAVLYTCGALGALSFCYSGYTVNPMDIAPKHSESLFGVVNTAATLPGILAVAITGWLVDITSSYHSAFILAAGLSISGALIFIIYGTGKKIID